MNVGINFQKWKRNRQIRLLLPSMKLYNWRHACLFVCLLSKYLEKLSTDFDEIFRKMVTQGTDVAGPDHRPDPEI